MLHTYLNQAQRALNRFQENYCAPPLEFAEIAIVFDTGEPKNELRPRIILVRMETTDGSMGTHDVTLHIWGGELRAMTVMHDDAIILLDLDPNGDAILEDLS